MTSDAANPPTARQEWRRHWSVVLAAALGFGLSSVTIYSLGPFIAPLEAEFGWSRGQITSGMTLYSVLGIIMAPFVGHAIDLFGPRRIAIVGVLGYGASFALLGFATASLWLWLALWFVLALFSAPIKPTVWTAGVSSVFDRGRGLAISVMLCGAALGSTLTPILSTWLIDTYGWRFAYPALIGCFLIFIAPIVFLFFTSAMDTRRGEASRAKATQPEAAAAFLPGLTWREGLPTWKFARLAAAAGFTTLVIISFVSNLIPILSWQGIGRQEAAGIAGMVGISTIFGRLIGGFLLDRINGGIVGGVSLLVPVITASLLLAYPGSVPVAMTAILILGLALGAELDCVAYLTTRHFGLKNFGVIFGVVSGILALATGLGPFIVNTAYDITGGYAVSLIAYIPLSLLASACFFSMGRYPSFEEPAQEIATAAG